MWTLSAPATTEGKVVLFTGDKGGCAPKGWCRPSMCQWQQFVLSEMWLCSPTAEKLVRVHLLLPNKCPVAHLHPRAVELPDVKWGLKVSTSCSTVGTEHSQQQGRLDAELPWMGSVSQGTVTTPHTSASGFASRPFPLLKPHPTTFTSFWCRNMFHFDKLTVVPYNEVDFSLLCWNDLKQWTNWKKPVA